MCRASECTNEWFDAQVRRDIWRTPTRETLGEGNGGEMADDQVRGRAVQPDTHLSVKPWRAAAPVAWRQSRSPSPSPTWRLTWTTSATCRSGPTPTLTPLSEAPARARVFVWRVECPRLSFWGRVCASNEDLLLLSWVKIFTKTFASPLSPLTHHLLYFSVSQMSNFSLRHLRHPCHP